MLAFSVQIRHVMKPLGCFTVCDVCDTKFWPFWSDTAQFDDFTTIFAQGTHAMVLFQVTITSELLSGEVFKFLSLFKQICTNLKLKT